MQTRKCPSIGERKHLLGEALSAVREAIHDNETGSAHPASPSRFRTCIANARTKKSRPRRGRDVTKASARKASLSAFPTHFLGALAT